MPDPKLAKKKTSPLFFLLLFVVLLAAGYYYYTFVMYTPPPISETNTVLPIVTTGDWSKDIYKNPAYTDLVNPISGKVEAGVTGNPSPFVQIAPTDARK